MNGSRSRPRLVGTYLKKKREELGLSQRAVGMLFSPPVTTQFISNVERGVTPLPPAHVGILTRALKIAESEIMELLEREYAAKLSGRLGREEENGSTGPFEGPPSGGKTEKQPLLVTYRDFSFFKRLYEAYATADEKTRETLASTCESILKISRSG